MIWGWRESAHPRNQLTPQPAHPPTLASLDAGGQMPQAHPPDAINISPLLVVGSRTPGNSC